MKITGTFLDEISHDIPSANWGPEEWTADFDAMQAVGIDKDVPILMSPYVRGRKQFEPPITLEEHESHWERIFARLTDYVDIVAFQDGQVEFQELPAFMEINTRLAQKHDLRAWSNVESFERGMPIDFLPIAWLNLRYKVDVAEAAGVEKLITFEFSHFMSPNSIYPSAHNLYTRYKNWISENEPIQ